MKKTILFLLLFIVGLVLLIYSWFLSYPLSIDSTSDTVFHHISILYWISLPLLLSSMFLLATTHEKYYINWILSIGIFLVVYSIYYFFLMAPGADSPYFRALSEYFFKTNNLTPNDYTHYYYQWPAFFILAKIVTSLTGINLANYSVLLYGIIGYLISTSVYVYASKFSRNGGLIAVVIFTVAMFSFLNYQFAPFSLAFAILLLMFNLETTHRGKFSSISMVLMFLGICIMHELVPAFLVLYFLIQSIVKKSAYYRNLFILFLFIYLVYQITFVTYSFRIILSQLINLPSDYSAYGSIISSRLLPAKVPIDILAQQFSRGLTILIGLICVLGFILLIKKRKLRPLDVGIFLTGIIYSGAGFVLNTVGYRTFPLIFLPVSLGALYLFDGKLRPYLKVVFLIMLISVVFIPIHNSFTTYPILFQTKADQTASNFLIEKYNWISPTTVLIDSSAGGYIFPQVNASAQIVFESSTQFNSNVTNYDCVFYTIGLGMYFVGNNISLSQNTNGFNIIYDSDYNYIIQKTHP
jgi:hypothetical protein